MSDTIITLTEADAWGVAIKVGVFCFVVCCMAAGMMYTVMKNRLYDHYCNTTLVPLAYALGTLDELNEIFKMEMPNPSLCIYPRIPAWIVMRTDVTCEQLREALGGKSL